MEKAKQFLKRNIRRKRFWIISGIVFLFALYFIFRPSSNIKNITTDFAKISDLKQTVLATGQVISNTDLNLSFNTSGVVSSIKVKVGDKVKKGDILATLNQDQERASLTSAKGGLAAANARLRKVLEGGEVTLAKIALDNAIRDYENVKKAQDTLVKNAYNNMLNSNPEAIPENGTSDYTAPIISGSYTLGKEGQIKLRIYHGSSGISYEVSGILNGGGVSNNIIAQPIGNSGLYIKFPDNELNVKDWIIEIPNKKASDYLTNYNLYQSALKTQESLVSQALSVVDQRQAEYDLKSTTSRGSDIDLAQADVISAQGVVEQAQARYNNTVIYAPAEGTITSVDIKVGELASALKEVIILQDVTNMYIETDINEANITNLQVSMPVDITFDSFGTDKIFNGFVTEINPSSTIISGVVNYKVKVSIDQVKDLRPGMTSNMTIKVKDVSGVISVPSRSIIVDKSGSKTIRLITNTKNKKWKEVPVTTGLEGDGGLTEITSGLNEGDEYVVLIKAK